MKRAFSEMAAGALATIVDDVVGKGLSIYSVWLF